MAEDRVLIKIKGHEKFALREGWLNKGVMAVQESPRIFLQSNAPETLGVGNNMVKSIRYWLKAFDLIEERAGVGAELTTFAQYIRNNDFYFQDMFTLWLLHSHLVKNATQATSWYLFFNNLDVEEYTKEQVEDALVYELEKYSGNEVNKNSVKDDVAVLLHMYCKDKAANYDPEEKNISPLSGLGLLIQSKGRYTKKQPDLSKLSEWVLLYELADVFEKTQSDSISIDSLYNGRGGIGNIYNLSRVALNDYLDRISNMSYIKVDRTAGLDMVYKGFTESAEEIIVKYYEGHR
jgi:hypothetical protein